MALNVKQKYPGTQGGAAQLYASDTRLSLSVELFWIPQVNSVSNSKKSSVKHGHRDQLKTILLSSINLLQS